MASAAIFLRNTNRPSARSAKAIAGISLLSVFIIRPIREVVTGLSVIGLQRMTEAVNSLGEYLSGWLKSAIPVVVGSAIVTGVTLTVQWTQARDTIEVFKEQIRELQTTSNQRFSEISRENNLKFQEVSASFNDRINAISNRLNLSDVAIRDMAVDQARAQERQLALGRQIEQRGKQRDDQLSSVLEKIQEQNNRIAGLERSLNDDRVSQARIGAAVDNILVILQDERRPPTPENPRR